VGRRERKGLTRGDGERGGQEEGNEAKRKTEEMTGTRDGRRKEKGGRRLRSREGWQRARGMVGTEDDDTRRTPLLDRR